MLAELKSELAWRRFVRKYSPDQPRVPAGNPDGGQWTDGGQSAGVSSTRVTNLTDRPTGAEPFVLSDASPDSVRPGAQYAQTRVNVDAALVGQETIDRTTHLLAKRLANVVDALSEGSGPAYGVLVHQTLKWSLRLFPIPGVEVEPVLGGIGPYREGSAKPDIRLENEVGDTMAYYDWKTGGARVSSSYADKVRRVGEAGPWIPVIQMSVTRGVLRKMREFF